MTIADKLSASGRAFVQGITDREPVNYVEAGMLYGIVSNGRSNASILTVLHNHAQDPELKHLIRDAIENQSEKTTKTSEDLLKVGDAQIPLVKFPERNLISNQDMSSDLRFIDMEIAQFLKIMHTAAQTALLMTINGAYQLDIGIAFRNQLNSSIDWGYRLQQLMLNKGWLPEMHKVVHH